MRILLWHVHGSWTTAFVQGDHDYVLPVLPDRGPDGRGRARTWDWPARVVERTPGELADEPLDVVVLQRLGERELVRAWTGREPGAGLPAVYLEHDAPHPLPADSRHPTAGSGLPVVHVTHFNELYWDCAGAPTTVIEHGVPDPGHLFTGELPRAAAMINEPVRRGRTVGTDLLPAFGADVDVDLFGALDGAVPGVTAVGDLPHDRLFAELARRRAYLHPARWTSLGLSLLEAMAVGLPVVAVAATEVGEAVPAGAGVVGTDLAVLRGALRAFVHDRDAAREAGALGRRHVLSRYGLARFLREWDAVLKEVTR